MAAAAAAAGGGGNGLGGLDLVPIGVPGVPGEAVFGRPALAYRTGDIGVWDEVGNLRLLGRARTGG